jgi:hypothetical protein
VTPGPEGQGSAGVALRSAVRGLAAVALAAALATAVLALLQRKLLYFPDAEPEARALARAARLGLAPVRGALGEVTGWRAPPPAGAPPAARVLVLHGNAGSALDRAYAVAALRGAGLPPLEVTLVEYPGYGPRPGEPSERALVDAATAAVDAVAREAAAPGAGGAAGAGRAASIPVLLLGESLGSAVAALAAAERPAAVRGVLLVTPLSSVVEVAARHYPFVPSALVRDRYEARAALARWGGPAAFLVAERDEIVFPDLGLSWHAAHPGPKALHVERGATHNGLAWAPGDPALAALVAFLLAPAAEGATSPASTP